MVRYSQDLGGGTRIYGTGREVFAAEVGSFAGEVIMAKRNLRKQKTANNQLVRETVALLAPVSNAIKPMTEDWWRSAHTAHTSRDVSGDVLEAVRLEVFRLAPMLIESLTNPALCAVELFDLAGYNARDEFGATLIDTYLPEAILELRTAVEGRSPTAMQNLEEIYYGATVLLLALRTEATFTMHSSMKLRNEMEEVLREIEEERGPVPPRFNRLNFVEQLVFELERVTELCKQGRPVIRTEDPESPEVQSFLDAMNLLALDLEFVSESYEEALRLPPSASQPPPPTGAPLNAPSNALPPPPRAALNA